MDAIGRDSQRPAGWRAQKSKRTLTPALSHPMGEGGRMALWSESNGHEPQDGVHRIETNPHPDPLPSDGRGRTDGALD